MNNLPIDVLRAAEVLWDYHCIDRPAPNHVDVVLALGSHDLRVAQQAAQATVRYEPEYLVIAGGSGKVTSGLWSDPEAEVFGLFVLQVGMRVSSPPPMSSMRSR